MSKKPRPPRKDHKLSTADIADRLRSTAEYYQRLAETLTDEGGRPLNLQEIEAVRVSFFPWIQEISSDLSYAYLADDEGRFDSLLGEMTDLIRGINQLNKYL